MFSIYFPGSSRHRILRFRVFSFSVCFCQKNFQEDLGAMASPSSPKDKFIINVINPYLAEVKKHPQTILVEDGVLHQEDLKGPIKEGSIEARLEEVEQEVFKYKKMVEHCVEANFDISNDLKAHYKKEMKEMWSRITALEERVIDRGVVRGRRWRIGRRSRGGRGQRR